MVNISVNKIHYMVFSHENQVIFLLFMKPNSAFELRFNKKNLVCFIHAYNYFQTANYVKIKTQLYLIKL